MYHWQQLKSTSENDQYDDTNDADYIRLYNEGKSTLDIAKIFNTSATTIRQHLVHNGVELRTATERMWNYHKKEIPKDFDDYQKLYNLYIENGISKKRLKTVGLVTFLFIKQKADYMKGKRW